MLPLSCGPRQRGQFAEKSAATRLPQHESKTTVTRAVLKFIINGTRVYGRRHVVDSNIQDEQIVSRRQSSTAGSLTRSAYVKKRTAVWNTCEDFGTPEVARINYATINRFMDRSPDDPDRRQQLEYKQLLAQNDLIHDDLENYINRGQSSRPYRMKTKPETPQQD